MKVPVTFRRFESGDETAVRLLHEQALRAVGAFGDGEGLDKDLDDILGHYINKGGEFLVGTLEGKIVAMGAFRRLSDTEVELKRMRVRPDLQGQGIGGELLDRLEKAARAKDYDAIILDVTTKQPVAQRLYESRGYKEFKRVKGEQFELIFYRKDLDYYRQHDLGL